MFYLKNQPVTLPIDNISTSSSSNQIENQTSEVLPVSNKNKKQSIPSSANSETFSLNAGTTNISFNVTGESLLFILNEAKERGEIIISGKEYPGLGFFVTELGSLKEADGKHLMYYINGKEASVGVSMYVPKASDIVVLELK